MPFNSKWKVISKVVTERQRPISQKVTQLQDTWDHYSMVYSYTESLSQSSLLLQYTESNNLPWAHHTTPENKHCWEIPTRCRIQFPACFTVAVFTSFCGYSFFNVVAHFAVVVDPTVELNSVYLLCMQQCRSVTATTSSVFQEKRGALGLQLSAEWLVISTYNDRCIWFLFRLDSG